MSNAYFAQENAVHNAADFNAKTGGDSDLGDSFRALREAEVIDHGFHPYIGGGIEIQLASGHIVGYWHGRDRHVVKGQIVRAGSVLGQVGTGGPKAVRRDGSRIMKAHVHVYIKKPGVKLPLWFWPSTDCKRTDRKSVEQFVGDHYENPVQFLRDSGALTTLAEYEAMFAPPRLLLVEGDNVRDLMGADHEFHGNGFTVAAKTYPARIYRNDPTPASIPALPPRSKP